MALRDQPYFPLYVQDYLTDEKLNMCSAFSQGIYVKIMCVLHKGEKYGRLLLRAKDKKTENPQENFAKKLSKVLPFSPSEIQSALKELIEEGVILVGGASGDEIYQPRMVKDGELSLKRSKVGKKGGVSKRGSKKEANLQAKEEAKAKQNTENEYEYESEYDNEKKKGDTRGKNDADAEPEIIQPEIWPTFKDFYEAYPLRKDPKRAQIPWDKLSQAEKEAAINYLPDYIAECEANKTPFRYPATFLNNNTWENEIQIQKTNQKNQKHGYTDQELVDAVIRGETDYR